MNTNKIKIKIGVFALAGLLQGALAIVASLGSIAEAFPGASPTLIEMLLSLPSLTSLVSALIVGKVATIISKKNLCLSGVILVIIGGMTPFFIHNNFHFLLVCCGILGAGIGIISTINPGIIAENFDGEERGATMGQMTAFVSVGAALLTYIGGVLSIKGWTYNYLVYSFAILIFIIAAITIPNKTNGQEQVNIEVENEGTTEKIKLNHFIFLLSIVGFAFLLVYSVFPNNISLYITMNNIGDSSTAGTASSISTIGGLIAGLIFGKILRLSGKYTFALAFFIAGVGLIIVVSSVSPIVIMAGSFFVGFSLSIFMAQAPFILSMLVNSATFPMAIAIFSSIISIATFVAPVVISSMVDIIGVRTPKTAMICGIAIAMVMAFILIITKFQDKCVKYSMKNYL